MLHLAVVAASPAALAPGGLLAWLIAGLIAGSLAGIIMRGRGFGCLLNILLGIAGAFLGGLIASLLLPGTTLHFWGSIVIGTLGSCLLLAAARAVSRLFRRGGNK